MKQIFDVGGKKKLFSHRATPGFLRMKMFSSAVVKLYYRGIRKTLCPQTNSSTKVRRHDHILGVCEKLGPQESDVTDSVKVHG